MIVNTVNGWPANIPGDIHMHQIQDGMDIFTQGGTLIGIINQYCQSKKNV